MNSWWVSVCTLGVKVTVCSGDVMGGHCVDSWCGVESVCAQLMLWSQYIIRLVGVSLC